MKKPLVFRICAALITALALAAVPVITAAGDPCCSVVSLDEANGMVVLRDNKSGKLEKIKLHDRAQLASLKVGQAADRSLGVRYCSIRSFEPCLDQARTHDCQPCPDSH
jgi:hypothetical protein